MTAMIEPPDGTLLLVCSPNGDEEEAVLIRDDTAAEKGGYGDRHWFEVNPENLSSPTTWQATFNSVNWDDTVLMPLHRDIDLADAVTPDNLEARIHELLEDALHLEDGEMMMPLKEHEIGELADSIYALLADE